MHRLAVLVSTLALIGFGFAQMAQKPPQPGTYVFKKGLDEYVIVLSPHKSGNFVVTGSWKENVTGKVRPIQGILYKATGNLKATYTETYSSRQGSKPVKAKVPLDGHWSGKDGVLVLQIELKNVVGKPFKNEKPKADPPKANPAPNLAGKYSGQDWGPVRLTGSGTSYSGTWNDGQFKGSLQLTHKGNGKYEGNWNDDAGKHMGSLTATAGEGSLRVDWICTGDCKGRKGTSTWTRKK